VTGWGKLAVGVIALGALAGVAVPLMIISRGVSARDEPTAIEAFMARRLRRLATPSHLHTARNPVARTSEVMASARAHFADHCASCHGNDGRGQTSLGRNLYPKAPDMTLPDTQGLVDGELFGIIENGIRLTGMPAWGNGTPESEKASWELVHLIRHFPRITAAELAEMASLNPRSRAEFEEEQSIDAFLKGGDIKPPHHVSH
jgi:mono/diheme cytochrome c family protein